MVSVCINCCRDIFQTCKLPLLHLRLSVRSVHFHSKNTNNERMMVLIPFTIDDVSVSVLWVHLSLLRYDRSSGVVEQEIASRTMKRVAQRTTSTFMRSAEGVCSFDLLISVCMVFVKIECIKKCNFWPYLLLEICICYCLLRIVGNWDATWQAL